ncbi:MAG: acyl-CoA dehydrogenase family protein [Sphingobium sp.]|nr:acyl-CoA dehydrogenase family protein [Sphingobium sp.]MBP9158526.1 acyl-CoA dehydrogenase family protein [Sphingobium sp.]
MTILTEEQTMLQDAARAWVAERAQPAALRAVRTEYAETGYDPQLYVEMVEMGWTGVVVPEEYDGFAFGYTSFGLLVEELGRTLTASPLISSALSAVTALVIGGSDKQKATLLPALVAGETVMTLAIDEGSHHAPAQIALTAQPNGTGWSLTGTKRMVCEGMAADTLIVAARTAGHPGDRHGITLFLCPVDASGITRTALRQIDSRGAALISFDGTALDAAAVLGTVNEGYALLEQILDRSRAVLAAEMLGSAVQAFETTVDYLKTRVQFGKPIGAFQALQHRATDMLAEIELTRSAVYAALQAIDEDANDIATLVSMAKALAGKTLRHIAQEMVQMHGGIGMTDEHDAGLYLKRAHAADVTFGNIAFHRERFASLAGF